MLKVLSLIFGIILFASIPFAGNTLAGWLDLALVEPAESTFWTEWVVGWLNAFMLAMFAISIVAVGALGVMICLGISSAIVSTLKSFINWLTD